jgi:hypothetical protein
MGPAGNVPGLECNAELAHRHLATPVQVERGAQHAHVLLRQARQQHLVVGKRAGWIERSKVSCIVFAGGIHVQWPRPQAVETLPPSSGMLILKLLSMGTFLCAHLYSLLEVFGLNAQRVDGWGGRGIRRQVAKQRTHGCSTREGVGFGEENEGV